MTNSSKINLVGPQLKLLRQWRGWTQNELSKRLGALGWRISRNVLAQMEITRKRITDCDLIFLAKALKVSITDFFPATFSQNIRAKIKSSRLMRWQASPRSHSRRVANPRLNRK